MQIFDLHACNWKRKCISGSCYSINSGLQCTDTCVNEECEMRHLMRLCQMIKIDILTNDNEDDNDF